MKCTYLEGENLRPSSVAEARKLIGSEIRYLCHSDIDRSGRGYFSVPRQGRIENVLGRNIMFDAWHSAWLPDIVELIVVSPSVAPGEEKT